jgi:hypothetical protein
MGPRYAGDGGGQGFIALRPKKRAYVPSVSALRLRGEELVAALRGLSELPLGMKKSAGKGPPSNREGPDDLSAGGRQHRRDALRAACPRPAIEREVNDGGRVERQDL